MKILFCPKCHQRVQIPSFFDKINIKGNARIKIKCGHCKKGEVTING
jgi:hypothetical protein